VLASSIFPSWFHFSCHRHRRGRRPRSRRRRGRDATECRGIPHKTIASSHHSLLLHAPTGRDVEQRDPMRKQSLCIVRCLEWNDFCTKPVLNEQFLHAISRREKGEIENQLTQSIGKELIVSLEEYIDDNC